MAKAQLYVFADDRIARAAKERALAEHGINLRKPIGPDGRVEELRQSRVFLDCGDKSDMFGMAVAEAQAMGVPAVVADVAAMRERVVDRETGFLVRPDDVAGFASAVTRLLADDAVWRSHHDAALRYNRMRGWDDVAADFEELRR